MSIRTTVTLENDVARRVREVSKTRGASFRDTLNDLLREALVKVDQKPKRTLKIVPVIRGRRVPGLNYDSVEALLTHAEGEWHR